MKLKNLILKTMLLASLLSPIAKAQDCGDVYAAKTNELGQEIQKSVNDENRYDIPGFLAGGGIAVVGGITGMVGESDQSDALKNIGIIVLFGGATLMAVSGIDEFIRQGHQVDVTRLLNSYSDVIEVDAELTATNSSRNVKYGYLENLVREYDSSAKGEEIGALFEAEYHNGELCKNGALSFAHVAYKIATDLKVHKSSAMLGSSDSTVSAQ